MHKVDGGGGLLVEVCIVGWGKAVREVFEVNSLSLGARAGAAELSRLDHGDMIQGLKNLGNWGYPLGYPLPVSCFSWIS